MVLHEIHNFQFSCLVIYANLKIRQLVKCLETIQWKISSIHTIGGQRFIYMEPLGHRKHKPKLNSKPQWVKASMANAHVFTR